MISVEKKSGGWEVSVDLHAFITHEEMSVYSPKSIIAHVISDRFSKEFSEVLKTLKKHGESIIERLKEDAFVEETDSVTSESSEPTDDGE